jgi:hypothetical protein
MQILPDIRNQLSSKGLFDAFKMQLIKDFDQSNFPSDFVGTLEPDYASIHKKIVDQLERTQGKSDFSLSRLLNRIDISDAQFNRYLTEYKNESRFSVIAELIIKRVLQKVVIRQHYKNKENL